MVRRWLQPRGVLASDDSATPMNRTPFTRRLRNLFLGGLVVVIPIVLTVNALVWLFRLLDGLAQPLAEGGARAHDCPASAS